MYCLAAFGFALDKSKNESGEIDFSGLLASVESSFADYKGILGSITDTETYCCKITFFGAISVGLYILYKYTTKKRLHRKGEEHGSARWATEAEAKRLADKKKVKKGEIDNNILLTQEVRMSLNTRQHRENLNVLVIGGSGSGKSRFYVKPNLMQLNTSYVVTDPKGELLRSTGKLLEENGYKIKVFNLIDMRNSHNYNPFAYVYDRKTGELNKSYVIKMVNVLMKNTKQEGASGGDQFWDDATKALLSALSFYLLEKGAESEKNFAWVMQLLKQAEVKEDEEDYESPLDIKFKELEGENPTSMAVSYYKDFKKAAGETAKSILISCAVRLQAFNLPDVANLTHTDTLELDKIGDEKTAVFVIIPSSDVTFNFLAAMMYTQLFDTLYDTANFKYGGRLPVHVRCLLDEFANIGTIPDFDKLLATMRSMEISANIIIQNVAQLKKMYEKSWEILTGNCDSLLFLGGKEASTTEMISKALGKETIDTVAQNRTKGHRNNSTSINNSIMGRELLTADELTVLPVSDCILMVRAYFSVQSHILNEQLTPVQLRAYLFICRSLSPSLGRCWNSYNDLAKMLGTSRSKVIELVAQLIRKKVISRQRMKTRQNRRVYGDNHYTVVCYVPHRPIRKRSSRKKIGLPPCKSSPIVGQSANLSACINTCVYDNTTKTADCQVGDIFFAPFFRKGRRKNKYIHNNITILKSRSQLSRHEMYKISARKVKKFFQGVVPKIKGLYINQNITLLKRKKLMINS